MFEEITASEWMVETPALVMITIENPALVLLTFLGLVVLLDELEKVK